MIHNFQTLGNHEFDHKIEGVVPFMGSIEAPIVVCNIDDSQEPTFQGKYKKSIVLERHGRKIGVIGVILATTNVSGFIFVFPTSGNGIMSKL